MSENIDEQAGSKASSPNETPKSQIDFQFLNFSHPSDAKASRARRAVRSHVTKQQHQREHQLQAARRTHSYQGTSVEAPETEQSLVGRPHAQTFPPDPPELSTTQTSAAQGQPPIIVTAAPQASSPEISSASTSPSASPTEGRIDPSDIYPDEWHPYIPRVMEHYSSNLEIDIPDLDGTIAKDLLRTRFLPFVMTDPAPLHAVMLIAASRFTRDYGPRSHTIDLLQLRGMAIREINNALEDPLRAKSDQVVAAVAMMAQYEALFGDRAIFNTHMTGLLRMVSLKGGLVGLGLDGLLERILLWIDSNASHIARTHLYFDKAAFPTTAEHPRPDPARFAGSTGR